MPFELIRHNFKTAQRNIEQAKPRIEDHVKTAANAAASWDHPATPNPAVLSNLDLAIARLETLKSKLTVLDQKASEQVAHVEARVAHLEQLSTIESMAGDEFRQWTKVRSDRLQAAYLARRGYFQASKSLMERKGIEKLVDYDAFQLAMCVMDSLKIHKNVDSALRWCGENKQALKKINVWNSFPQTLAICPCHDMANGSNRARLNLSSGCNKLRK